MTTMRKIKIFRLAAYNDEMVINHWLAEHKAAIIHNMLQTECVVDGTAWITITIFYYEGEQ